METWTQGQPFRVSVYFCQVVRNWHTANSSTYFKTCLYFLFHWNCHLRAYWIWNLLWEILKWSYLGFYEFLYWVQNLQSCEVRPPISFKNLLQIISVVIQTGEHCLWYVYHSLEKHKVEKEESRDISNARSKGISMSNYHFLGEKLMFLNF